MIRCFMFFLFSALLSFPCSAEVSEADFLRLDANGDGVVSQEEFIQGVNKTGIKKAPSNSGISPKERKKIIDETVAGLKPLLPKVIDNATTWTEVYGIGDELNYVYRINMDTSMIPDSESAEMRSLFEDMVCQQARPMICKVAKEVLLANGISIKVHYNETSGKLLGECRFVYSDCP